jgi:hypothetical protein
MPVGLGVAVLLFSSLIGLGARADVVDPTPIDCPLGAVSEAFHGGPVCVVDDCSANPARCEAGMQCSPLALCTRPFYGGGGIKAGFASLTGVIGRCAPDGTCSTGTCSTWAVCVPPGGIGGANSLGGAPPTGGTRNGNGGSAPSSGGTTANGGSRTANGNSTALEPVDSTDADAASDDSGCNCQFPGTRSVQVGSLVMLGLVAWTFRRQQRMNAR